LSSASWWALRLSVHHGTIASGQDEDAKINHYEDAESIALWQRCQMNRILRNFLYHIPNGGQRKIREAARMKRMGVRSGVSDYHLPVPCGIYCGCWIELKASKAKQPRATKEQIQWRDHMRGLGHAAFIVVGWELAYSLLETYTKLKEGESMEELGEIGCLK
jgi:hypothetical protein